MQVYSAIPDDSVRSDQGFIREPFLDRHKEDGMFIRARPKRTADPDPANQEGRDSTLGDFLLSPRAWHNYDAATLVVLLRKQSSQRDREKGLKLPNLGQLNSVWNGVLKDATARAALDQLKRDGFDIGRLSPRDPTFDSPSWADYVAAIPLLENGLLGATFTPSLPAETPASGKDVTQFRAAVRRGNTGWYQETSFGDDGRSGEGLGAQAAKRPHELCPRIDVRPEVTEHGAFLRSRAAKPTQS